MSILERIAQLKERGIPDPCPCDIDAARPKWTGCHNSNGCVPFNEPGKLTRCGQHHRVSDNHCAACHLTFTQLEGFDAHRYGPYSDRHCMTVDELVAAGWTCKPGDLLDGTPTAELWSLPTEGRPNPHKSGDTDE